MSKTILFTLLSASLVVAAVSTGCSQKPVGDQSPTPSEPSQSEPTTMSHEGHEHEGGGQMGGMTHEEPASSDNSDALAKLSPADRELAEKQKICPVSGERLGAMGTPYKVTVEGQDVMLCCSGCEAKIKANPKEYLAKLKQ